MLKICCCWDDGVLNDIKVTELLRKYNCKATFNLNPGLHSANRQTTGWTFRKNVGGQSIDTGYVPGKLALGELTSVYEGFQVASHGWKHMNAGENPDDAFLADAVDARKFLEDKFQRTCRGYAWPCGRHTPSTVKLLKDAGFAYGRTCENTDDVRAFSEPLLLASSCHYLNNDFYQKLEAARKNTGYFYFWGHSYEMMDDQSLWSAFEEKLKYIAQNPDNVWIDVIDLASK